MTALFSGTWAEPGKEPGYGLTSADVTEFGRARSLDNIPVTVNHNGLEGTLGVLDAAGIPVTKESFGNALSRTATGAAVPVGRVVSSGPGTSVVFTVDESFRGVREMLRRGLFNGLSLTHVESGGRKEALELTLTSDPARRATVAFEYKPTEIRVVNTAAMSDQAQMTGGTEQAQLAPVAEAVPAPAPTEPAPTDLEAMMGRLSEGDQQLFLARLQEAETAYTKATTAQASAEAEAEKARTAAAEAAKKLADHQADQSIYDAQMDYLKQFLSPEEAKRLDGVSEMMAEGTLGGSQKAFGRVIQACSRALAGASTTRPVKRRAVESAAASVPAGASASSAVSSAAGSAPASVRNLLRSTFDKC